MPGNFATFCVSSREDARMQWVKGGLARMPWNFLHHLLWCLEDWYLVTCYIFWTSVKKINKKKSQNFFLTFSKKIFFPTPSLIFNFKIKILFVQITDKFIYRIAERFYFFYFFIYGSQWIQNSWNSKSSFFLFCTHIYFLYTWNCRIWLCYSFLQYFLDIMLYSCWKSAV